MDRRNRIEPTFRPADAAAGLVKGDAVQVGRVKRIRRGVPRGLAVIAALTIIGGLGLALVQLFAHEVLQAAFNSIGVSGALAVWVILILGLLMMVGGALALDGNKMGWALLIALVAYEGVASIRALMFAHTPGMDVAFMIGGTLTPIAKFGATLFLDALVMLYLLRPRVRAYFQLTSSQAWLFVCAVVIVSGAAIALSYQGA